MNRVTHFEIQSDDPLRAVRFYSETFGWKISQWGEQQYWLVITGDGGPGINGGILPRPTPRPESGQPVNAFVCTVEVEDLDGMLARALKNGAKVALPKMPIPTIGWLAYLHDTEGNILGMMQNDKNAK